MTSLNIDAILLDLNGFLTIFFGSIIILMLLRGRLYRHLFYYTWSIGFILYGIEILVRAFFNVFLIVLALLLLTIALFFIGIWSIGKSKVYLYVIASCLLFYTLVAILYFANVISLTFIYDFGYTLYFLPIIVALFYHRKQFGKSVDKFVIGFILLYLSNQLLLGSGEMVDLFAMFSKFLIFLGITDQDLAITIEKIREGLKGGIPEAYTGKEPEGGLRIIRSSSTITQCLELVKTEIEANLRNDLDTYLFSFQDTVPHRELRRLKWIKPNKVNIFIFSGGIETMTEEFTIIPMDITHIGATLSEIIKKGKSNVFLLNLSVLIHVFGAYPVYNMLLDKMGALRENGINLFAFLYPETHNDNSVISLFENIADEIIEA